MFVCFLQNLGILSSSSVGIKKCKSLGFYHMNSRAGKVGKSIYQRVIIIIDHKWSYKELFLKMKTSEQW